MLDILGVRHSRKNEHYKDTPANIVFELDAVKTLGEFGDTSWRFLKRLAGRVEEETRERKSFAYLRQKIFYFNELLFQQTLSFLFL